APAAHLSTIVNIIVDQRRRVDELERRSEVDRLPGVGSAEGPEREERDHRPDAFAARFDDIPGDVMEERFFRHDASSDLCLDEGHLVGDAKVLGSRHQGGPNLCYRLDLYNRFRGMLVRLPRTALPLERKSSLREIDSSVDVHCP